MTAQLRHQGIAPTGPATPEAELVTSAKGGDEAAVRELIRRMNPRLFRIARGIVASDADAEEVVQETYLKAFTKLDNFRAEARFSTWITRIAINTARMHLRRVRPQEEYDTVTEDQKASDSILAFPGQHPNRPEAALGRAQVRAFLESAVAHLPPDLRLPFLMREVENMSILAIAHDLSLNPITVKTRLFRARRRLRIALEERTQGGFDAIFPFDGARCADLADRVVAKLKADLRL
ncbi:ECF RNA polymerase sigma-E factor (plasmid) [Antarctobacter heliothermus]|uniref:RNA polymerase sigma factor n=1 Tax=Antarctobacter heliothermus TaxID=74033 RepID=A0A222EB98_9RHOB|nr:RNA polymerase sigma factor [Antarctobacter heliothermus]ASP23463.1 ECF RNA polymerase sigma-E factor [Antarctobacter heliothermus]MBT56245.1 RNA polymerase subunit sigma [Mameliella sp.]